MTTARIMIDSIEHEQTATKAPIAAACPLCDSAESRPSWLKHLTYAGHEFQYVQCLACGSLYCSPMPNGQMLSQMYGPEYGRRFQSADAHTTDPKQPEKVVECLKNRPTGVFLDYGCGAGKLLTAAVEQGWQAVGLEFDATVAKTVAEQTGVPVYTAPGEIIAAVGYADVLHLGDVIEHLTDLNRQMPEILKLLKPGGILMAQGPLEANANLFAWLVRLSRTLRRSRWTEMAPYHVLLATARGQQRFFERFGLEQMEYSIHEVDWPAPSRLSRHDLLRARVAGLFAVRRISKAVSALQPGRWGNRYFYIGRLSG